MVCGKLHQTFFGTKNSIFKYHFALSLQGRVVSDTLIYNLTSEKDSEPHFVIECDEAAKPKLMKMFRFYNLRKKVGFTFSAIP